MTDLILATAALLLAVNVVLLHHRVTQLERRTRSWVAVAPRQTGKSSRGSVDLWALAAAAVVGTVGGVLVGVWYR